MLTIALVLVIILLAAIMSTLSGFGFALVVMPLLTFLLGVRTAAPLVALAGLTIYTINLFRYRQRLVSSELWRLGLASALGVPVGALALTYLDEGLIQLALGMLMVVYAGYELARPAKLRLESQRWSFLAGFVAGCLGGAYNTAGPPIVAYGSLRQWPKEEFRAIMQAIFLFTAVLTIASHYAAQRLTGAVLTLYAYLAPVLLLGILVGARVDPYVDRRRFRTLVAGLILVLGVVLVVEAVWGGV